MATTDNHDVLALLREGRPRTKTELAQLTGQARSTIGIRLDALLERGLVTILDEAVSTGGRPSLSYAFNAKAGVVLAADLGATHAYLGVTDLAGEILAHRREELAIGDGPVAVLDRVADAWDDQLVGLGLTAADVRGAGLGLPGPVEHSTGRPVSPPIMPGWDDFDVPAYVAGRFDVPVLVDNDVNILALGEWTERYPDETDLLVVKVATGIGAGLVCAGRLSRGAQGAAGDIGHIQVAAESSRVCRCGQSGCLEAYASGRGIAQSLADLGSAAATSDDVVELVRSGDPEATRLSREAGRLIGEVLSACVAILNPGRIVVGGEMARSGETLLAGIREAIYQRAQPLATRQLSVVTMQDPERGGVRGAARMALDAILAA
ncbi:ROK family transcriptional regulator [Demequina sp. SYSU T00039]|uniref:ROK family transcriptional regulator n=1 Tax=Demequina lignilytica TaxID=3051663 RepID=A0AAW7M2G3_9MICO|nr:MULTISPECIES: ROK family transcriptional regulator [unclassified Demequina]MDN4477930.1 ROK family transcriptional regulator [Demequina sp. SYSU T00039-1]MDN4487839.1 ROK family transcriptional regulator [Demequina sp. SYSU T00039]MDN4490778.1 ROK family transcriptional regulator [Demequina sp. SYSU T00068]